MIIGYAKPYFVNDDTVRFFLTFDNHLYSLCDDTEQSIELAMPNPVTVEIADNLDVFSNPIDMQKLNSYDGEFYALGESGLFVVFRYHLSGSTYYSMLDKRTNNIVSVVCYGETGNNTSGIMAEFFNHLYYNHTDGKYLYGRYFNKDLAKLLEGHDDLLDARLKKTQAEYHAFLERNAGYIKDLEAEDRDNINVMVKIKLKD